MSLSVVKVFIKDLVMVKESLSYLKALVYSIIVLVLLEITLCALNFRLHFKAFVYF